MPLSESSFRRTKNRDGQNFQNDDLTKFHFVKQRTVIGVSGVTVQHHVAAEHGHVKNNVKIQTLLMR